MRRGLQGELAVAFSHVVHPSPAIRAIEPCTRTLSGCPRADSDGIRPLPAGKVPAGEQRCARKATPEGLVEPPGPMP